MIDNTYMNDKFYKHIEHYTYIRDMIEQTILFSVLLDSDRQKNPYMNEYTL